MEQSRFEWAEATEAQNATEVVLDPKTTRAVVELMSRVLAAVVRLEEEEARDER